MLYQIYICIALSVLFFRLAFPIFVFPFFAFVALIPLLCIGQKALDLKLQKMKAWAHIWLGLVLMNVSVLYWSFVDTPIGSTILCIGNGFCMSLPFALWLVFYTRLEQTLGKVLAYLSFVFFWVAIESLRFYGDFAFPWLTLGNCFATLPTLVQWYSYTGVLGGSFWIVCLNILIFIGLQGILPTQQAIKLGIGIFILPTVVSFGLLFSQNKSEEKRSILILHPSMKRYGNMASNGYQQAEKLTHTITQHITPQTSYILLPETAMQNKNWVHLLSAHLPTQNFRKLLQKYPNAHLITGTITSEYTPQHLEATKEIGTTRYYKTYNNVMQITKDTTIQMRSKEKLVPYEERRPHYLRWFDNVYFYWGGEDWNYTYPDYTQPATFYHNNRQENVLPLICYESVFYEFAAQKTDAKTGFITCSANEIWYTQTEGAEQAYLFCKILAICTRKYIARSSDFGVSCLIDTYGNTLLKESGKKPAIINTILEVHYETTFFTCYGDWVGKICLTISFLVICFLYFFRKK
jgi:apolipoprotein N-acyltransferase